MATCRWLSVSADLTAAAAWSNGAAPTNGDTVIFPAQATLAPSANLTGLTLVTVALWYVEDGCAIDLGTSGRSIEVGATNFVLFGAGNNYISNQTTANTSTILIAPTNDDSQVVLSGNSFKNIWCASGITDLSTGGYSTGAIFVSKSPNGQSPKLSVKSSAGSALATLAVSGGKVEYGSSSGVTTVLQSGGGIECIGTGGFGTLRQSGGYHSYRSTTTMSVADIYGGTFDISQGAEQRTVTLATIWPGAKYMRDPNVATVTSELILSDQIGLT